MLAKSAVVDIDNVVGFYSSLTRRSKILDQTEQDVHRHREPSHGLNADHDA
jgi:hypothetical protein